jgi:hypothetical protein
MSRSHSSNSVQRITPESTLGKSSKGRARSSSLVTVTEVGGDEPENMVDRMGLGSNENAAWVNAPGKRQADRADFRGMAHTSRFNLARKDSD